MPMIASAEEARAGRRRASSNGTAFWLTTYIGANRYMAGSGMPAEPGQVYPMAFLVEQDPGAVVGAHYHQADQFQVVIGGSGRLGRHDVSPGDVHFAGAWSAYGPLAAGADGLQYFTLRNGWDPGARYMEFPDNRAALRAIPRRHREVIGEIDATGDGMCVQRLRVLPGKCITGPAPGSGRGQFWLVLSGAMSYGEHTLSERSCVFVHPDGPPFTAVAAAEGLTAVMLQFPGSG